MGNELKKEYVKKIIAKFLNPETIDFILQNVMPIKINKRFGLQIFEIQNGVILKDNV